MRRRVRLGNRWLDLTEGVVEAQAGITALRVLEIELLTYLMDANERAISQEELLTQVWGYSASSATQTVRTTIHQLRQKLEDDPGRPEFLVTVRGQGYQLVVSSTPQLDLPARRGTMVGAGHLVEQVLHHLETHRLLSLVGPPGVGKTRLALEVAHCCRGRSKVWVDASMAKDALGLSARVAAALTLPLGSSDPIEQIANALRTAGPMLVVLDNLEQLLAALPDTLDRWLELAPEAVFLATSRERLGLIDELIIPIAPLDLPRAGADHDELKETTAGLLLLTRAAEAGAPLDELVDPASLVALVLHLEGLPLAIELAAAQLPFLPSEELLRNLNEPGVLFGPRRTPARHQTLDQAIGWSLDLLSDSEKAALTRLATFEGSFDLRSARDLLQPIGNAIVLLRRLTNASLVSVEGQGVYRILLPIREFLRHKADKEQYQQSRLHHLEHMAGLGAPASLTALVTTAQGVRRLVRALPDLQAAAHLGLGAPEHQVAVVRAALQAIHYVGPYELARPLVEGLIGAGALTPDDQAEMLALLAGLQGRRAESEVAWQSMARAESLRPTDTRVKAWVSLYRGRLLLLASELNEAHACFVQAAEAFEAAGSVTWAAQTRVDLTEVGYRLGTSASQTARDLEDLLGKYGDVLPRRGYLRAVAAVAGVAAHDLPEPSAIQRVRDAVNLARLACLPTEEALLLRTLSLQYELVGDPQRALSCAQAAYEIFNRFGNPPEILLCLGRKGAVLCTSGRHLEAIEVLTEVIEGFVARRMDGYAAYYLFNLANSHSQVGASAAAEAAFDRGYEIARRHLLKRETAFGDYVRAQHLHRLGETKLALELLVCARETLREASGSLTLQKLDKLEVMFRSALHPQPSVPSPSP